jgi:hypothetical protein
VSSLCWVSTAPASTVTIAPEPLTDTGNCFPFGIGTAWTPNLALFYKDIPPFELKSGDVLAFDLATPNEVNIQLQIGMAEAAVNGGTTPAEPFTTIASNTQLPANPLGDMTLGNYELRFTAETPFSFSGGGLILRFSNPSAAFAADSVCSGLVAGTTVAGGFFVSRSFADADGAPPWQNETTDGLAAFQLLLQDPPPPPPPDTTAPDTELTSGPVKTRKKTVHFGFVSDDVGATFSCRLAGKNVRNIQAKTYGPCTSPKEYRRLRPGKYRFSVFATDAAGNDDPTPAIQRFKILKHH